MSKNYLFAFLLISLTYNMFSQKKTTKVYGKVTDKEMALSEVTIYLEEASISTVTKKDGSYSMNVPLGTYTLICSATDYITQKIKITVKENEPEKVNIKLTPVEAIGLEEVRINKKSAIQKTKELPFNLVVLDAKSMYNSTLDLAGMLDKASGVKIRQTGGVGSNTNISLNGFTGRHIKLFMDGVPMDGFGSAFQLNNIPVSVADRIEVYKGVVPVEFGADAMGGVINIVTNQSANSFLDASYSFGSFNTHKSNISLGYTAKSGFSVQLNAFQNYSDNNYRVKTNVLNLTTGNYSNEQIWVRRFNDTYHNETVLAKIGFVNKAWADRIFLGITLGQEEAQIQNANIMKIVYGKRKRTGTTFLPSFSYEKKSLFLKDLNVRITANYNRNYNQNIDTVARQYNWRGEFREKSSKGEGTYSLSKYFNDNYSATTNINYSINKKIAWSVNNVSTGYERKNANQVGVLDAESVIDTMRRANLKNVLGTSLSYRPNTKWNMNLFGKQYYQKVIGPMDVSTQAGTTLYKEKTEKFSTTGYGMANTYFFKNIQMKLSFEKAFRLPSDTELFGDEITETGNAKLKAENSLNYNFGITLNQEVKNGNVLYVDSNLYYRDINDYIQRLVEQRYGTAGYTNHGKVRNIGIDTEIRYYFKNKWMIGGNITYQDIRNMEKYVSGSGTQKSVTYHDRLPNVPYFFGNLDSAYYIHDVATKGNVLSIGYTFNFVGEFFLNWESLGNQSSKATLPTQLYHDFNVSYSIQNGKYNIAFEARNITDAMLYDNFSLQKPGRSFSLKLRYYIANKKSN